jgi:GxxExxY protein
LILYKKESYDIIGAAMEVHNELGSGFLESVYHEALAIEFEDRKIPFISEKTLEVVYKQRVLNKYFEADFICFDQIIVEIKSVTELKNIHKAQVINYLKATGKKLGILINFGEESLKYERLVRF